MFAMANGPKSTHPSAPVLIIILFILPSDSKVCTSTVSEEKYRHLISGRGERVTKEWQDAPAPLPSPPSLHQFHPCVQSW